MKLSPLKHWRWADEVYDVSVVLLHGPWAAARTWLNHTFGDDVKAVGNGTGAKTIWIDQDSGTAIVLWFPAWFKTTDGKHLGVLAHESFHAAEFVLRERGLALTDASDEAYAYYIAWIFRECHKRLSR